MIGAISNALSGLMAASKRAEASAGNIANLSTTGSVDSSSATQPYAAVTTTQTAQEGGGVSAAIVPKSVPIVNVYAPDSPFANKDGVVGAPNVDLAEEAVNLKLAEIAYKANVSTLNAAQEMTDALLSTFDKKA